MSRMLRQYLETRADQVEAVLLAHHAPGRITGGTVGPRLIRLFLVPAPEVRLATIYALQEDLALALKVSSLRISRAELAEAVAAYRQRVAATVARPLTCARCGAILRAEVAGVDFAPTAPAGAM